MHHSDRMFHKEAGISHLILDIILEHALNKFDPAHISEYEVRRHEICARVEPVESRPYPDVNVKD